MTMLINTEGLEPIVLPQDAPPYRVAQLRLKRDSYLLRLPVARTEDVKYLLFRIFTLNLVIETGKADVNEVILTWRRVYDQSSMNDIDEEWDLLTAYVDNGAQHLKSRHASLDQLYPNGKRRTSDD